MKTIQLISIMVAALLLSSCGSGGSSNSDTGSGSSSSGVVSEQPSVRLKLVKAKVSRVENNQAQTVDGLPLDGGQVNVK